jgi:hypothetical protein
MQSTIAAHTSVDNAFSQLLQDRRDYIVRHRRISPFLCAFYASAWDALCLAGIPAELQLDQANKTPEDG